jgi:hypothetical protein
MPRSQQDSWEKVPPSKRRKDGPVFVREVALDNLRAMCQRVSTKGRQFTITGNLLDNRVQVTEVVMSGGVTRVATVFFRTQPPTFHREEQPDNPTVTLEILRVGDGRHEKIRKEFEPLLTCPTLWRREPGQPWETHGETYARLGGSPLQSGHVYCTVCASRNVTRCVGVKEGVYTHNSNDGRQYDQDHQATPGEKWYDVCTFCDLPGGNSGPPPDPDAPQPPTPKLDGQDPDSPIDPKALADMRERGGTWFAYVNMDLDSSNPGARQYLKCGEDCTLTTPPKHMPDTKAGLGWRYLYKGTVDTQTGLIAEGKWPGEPKP